MDDHIKHMDTKLIHSGEPHPRIQGAVNVPIFQSSTFEYAGQASYHDLRYIRLNNTPNHVALHAKLAALEGGETAVVTASGNGRHHLGPPDLPLLWRPLPRPGLCLWRDPRSDYARFAGAGHLPRRHRRPGRGGLGKGASPGDPSALCGDHHEPPSFKWGIWRQPPPLRASTGSSPSSTTPLRAPMNFRPLEWGFDLSIHSATKYLNGHSDIVAGAVIGRGDLVEKVTHKLNHLGGSLDPPRLLSPAPRAQDPSPSASATRTRARAVSRRSWRDTRGVRLVHYPGLESHQDHDRAARLLDGYGGMLSFELEGNVALADAFIDHTTLPISAPSLGGVETLITRPATTSHAGVSPEDLQAMGISETLIRLSVGPRAPGRSDR